jgi:hypothetical protein
LKPKAVFFNLWEKHYPVVKAFAEANPDSLIILPYAGFLKYGPYQAFADRILPLDQVLGPGETEALAFAAAEKVRFLSGFLESPSWRSYCSGLGVEPGAAAQAIGEGAGDKLLQQIIQIECLERLRSEVEIRATVVNEEYTLLPKCIAIWSRQAGIPLLQISHSLGMVGWYSVTDRILSDAIAVYGSIVADGPMETGLRGDRVFVSGNPDWARYAAMLPHKAAFRREIQERFFAGQDTPVVVFGTTWNAHLSAMMDGQDTSAPVSTLFRAIAGLKRSGKPAKCIVKLRVNNDASYEERFSELAAREGLAQGDFAFARTDLEKLMLGADAVVSVDSTLSSEALLADTVSINLIGEVGWRIGPYYPKHSGILECAPDELASCLEGALYDSELKRHLKALRDGCKAEFQGGGAESSPVRRLAGIVARMAERGTGRVSSRMRLGTALERQTDPIGFLRETLGRLADGAEIEVSYRNASHWDVVRDLIQGKWSLPGDDAPIRFYTLESMEALLRDAGFTIVESASEGPVAPPDDAGTGLLKALGIADPGSRAHLGVRRYTTIARKASFAGPRAGDTAKLPPGAGIAPGTAGSRCPVRIHVKRAVVILRPASDCATGAAFLRRLEATMALPFKAVFMAPPDMAEEYRQCLPATAEILELPAGGAHSRAVLARLARATDAEMIVFADPSVKFGHGWDAVLASHLAEGTVVAPLLDTVGGTQSVFHYLPSERFISGDPASLSREVRMRYPGMAMASDWIHGAVLAFGASLLSGMAGLEDEADGSHFLGLVRKLKAAGARLRIAKDVFASVKD